MIRCPPPTNTYDQALQVYVGRMLRWRRRWSRSDCKRQSPPASIFSMFSGGRAKKVRILASFRLHFLLISGLKQSAPHSRLTQMDLLVDQVVLPGDRIGNVVAGRKIGLGQGLMQDDDAIVATKAGVLRCKAEKYWVENTQRRVRKALTSAMAGKCRFWSCLNNTSLLTFIGVLLHCLLSSSSLWWMTLLLESLLIESLMAGR